MIQEGYATRVLHVDLQDGRSWVKEFAPDEVLRFVGGRGLNARLLWLHMLPGIDPLGPGNPLIFGVGPLTGTHVPSSGRTTVTCKSPATSLYIKSTMGGHWGAALRFAGYSHLVVHGKASAPVAIAVSADSVHIRDASNLWGCDVRETEERLKGEVGEEVEIAAIGPAGENLVRFAGIMCSVYNTAGRGGVGAVMGSKRLKAVMVGGDKPLHIADPSRFNESALRARQILAEEPGAPRYYLVGTAGSVLPFNEFRAFPSYNFKRGYFEGAERLSGHHLVEAGYLKRRAACFVCPLSCHRYTTVTDGPWAGTYAGGPEYETISALGAGCGVDDPEVVMRANELCNIYGLDTISTGGAIQWLMESWERGIITAEDTTGLEPTWGNGEAVVELVRQIAYREGIGDLLAEGTRRAAERIGHDSYQWAIEAKGLEQSRVETRCAKAYALAFAVNPRGPDHLHSQPMAEFGLRPDTVELIREITGDARYANPNLVEKRAEIVRWHEDTFALTDSLGLCSFLTTSTYAVKVSHMAELLSACTGLSVSEDDMWQAGRRILNLERAINVGEGLTRAHDRLPWRLMHEESPDKKGAINSPAELSRMLDEYYVLHGWDVESGWPARGTLEELDLTWAADRLASLGRLPS